MLNSFIVAGGQSLFKRSVAGGMSLARRSAEGENDNFVLPPWALAVLFLTTVVLIPALVYASYTLGSIFPVLAIVEDPNPPAYQRVSLNEEADAVAEDDATAALAASENQAPPAPISASLRALHRLLYSVSGWRGAFRGLTCALVYSIAVGFVTGIVGSFPLPFVPAAVGSLVASLALVQLSTAWIHIVMTPPNPAPFYRRLPPFKKTFKATSIPVVIVWVASLLPSLFSLLVAGLLGLPSWDPRRPHEVPAYTPAALWKVAIVLVTSVVIIFVAVIPALVLQIRVQASLLPPEEDAIIPFDRAFGGAVEPAIVGGKGYVSMKDALKTVSRASWIRIYLLHAKVFAASFVIYLVFAAVLVPEMVLMSKKPA